MGLRRTGQPRDSNLALCLRPAPLGGEADLGSLIGQQARGSVPDYTHRLVKRAAEMLANELAASYEEDWLAELKALENKPLSGSDMRAAFLVPLAL